MQIRLPDGVRVDELDGAAWVTLISFRAHRTRLAVGPPVPYLSEFTETNLRTYVIGPDGRDGLWFLTLETDSLPTVLAARLIGIPYRWARMTADRAGPHLTYGSRRRSTDAAMHATTVRADNGPDVDDARAHWLTGRWRAWTRLGHRFATVPVEHEAWPLRPGLLVGHEDSLLAAVSLDPPAEPPLVHTSPGVHATLGWPRVTSHDAG